MYRIRFHGRGGQGLKTASRILGSAFFAAGFDVQDAPRYGAERRGAPITAYVRAGREPIAERGVIDRPDLVVLVDETLLSLIPAEIERGATADTVLLVNSTQPPANGRTWPGPVVPMPELGELAARGGMPLVATACAGAAARLTGAVSGEAVREAVAQELAALGETVVSRNLELALKAYHEMDGHTGLVHEGDEPALADLPAPRWVELRVADLLHGMPAVLAAGSSARSRTGLWRTERPVIDREACKGCWWICGTCCPDGVIHPNAERLPEIDYEHCKGCLICLEQCPSHAIAVVPEREANGTHAQEVNRCAS